MGKHPPKPVELWAEDYYERTPEDLLATDLAISQRNLDLACRAARRLLPPIQAYVDPAVIRTITDGPTVWVVNHLDMTDPPAVCAVADGLSLPPPRYLAMAELLSAERPWLAGLIASLGGIPIDRAKMLAKDKKAVVHLYRMADYILKELKVPLVVYGEGGILPKPLDYRHKVSEIGGLATTFARRANVPLIVWGLGGTRHSALQGLNPLTNRRTGVCIKDMYDSGSGYPTDLELRTRMQTAANIANTLTKERA